MPTSTRREKLDKLNTVLEVLHTNNLSFKTPAIADRIAGLLKTYGFSRNTEQEYVRLLVDALSWEEKNAGKEFRFA